MQLHFARLVKDCGIEPANFHALRHTFATRSMELGCDGKCLSELLGHATVNMTLNRYVHPTIEHKRRHMHRLTAHLTANPPVVENLLGI